MPANHPLDEAGVQMKIFFDVDGVLIDGWHANTALRKPWDLTIEADLGIDREAFRTLFFGAPGAKAGSPMVECVSGRRDLLEALADVLPRAGYSGSASDFAHYWFEKDSNLNPAVLAFAEQLRETGGAKLYIATGQEHHRARYLWNGLGFSGYFERMFYSAEIGHLKKDVRFFEFINRELGIGAEDRPLFFDDQPEIVTLAISVGWDATEFTSASDIREHPRLVHLWS
jgi:putative hydrolase of the HAD superfamily